MNDTYKNEASRLDAFLRSKFGYKLKHGHLLEAIAAIHERENWNTLAAEAARRQPVAQPFVPETASVRSDVGMPASEASAWLDQMLFEAEQSEFSMLTFVLEETGLSVLRRRYRKTAYWRHLPTELGRGVVSRLKERVRMDPEATTPQEGSFGLNPELDISVATLPTKTGEHITIRLNCKRVVYSLEQIMPQPSRDEWMGALTARASGLFVVAGATGTRKTTMLSATASQLVKQGRDVCVISDGFERLAVEGARNISLTPKEPRTFEAAMRLVRRSIATSTPEFLVCNIDLHTSEDANSILDVLRETQTKVVATAVASSTSGVISRLSALGLRSEDVPGGVGVLRNQLFPRNCSHCGGKGCARCFGDGAAADALLTHFSHVQVSEGSNRSLGDREMLDDAIKAHRVLGIPGQALVQAYGPAVLERAVALGIELR